MKPAVIIPWRVGETELQSTIESATASIGKGVIIPIEDKLGDGPAMTRHRGIEAATDADVIVIVDAHMTFDGDVLRAMAREVARKGGLQCAKCYHNEGCTWEGGATYYAGADIHYKGEDQNGRQAILWKWSADQKPGKRACIGGACYVFRRDWYYETGQCLSALPAWGCDEEALSICAWLSGHWPRVFDGKVAHRYRPRTPWKAAARPIVTSRAAMLSAIVPDAVELNDLMAWQGVGPMFTPEVNRWKEALRKLPKTWEQWKAEVPIMPKKTEAIEKPKATRANYGATETNRLCPKCGSEASKIDKTRHVGTLTFRYRTCDKCGQHRVSRQAAS
jgi:predicted RNA-binding Zn-ribbon protein involved in translation (DUF1610 family)